MKTNKDSFWTIGYKGHWIHGHHDNDLRRAVIRVVTPNNVTHNIKAQTLDSAKRLIRRLLQKGQPCQVN